MLHLGGDAPEKCVLAVVTRSPRALRIASIPILRQLGLYPAHSTLTLVYFSRFTSGWILHVYYARSSWKLCIANLVFCGGVCTTSTSTHHLIVAMSYRLCLR